MTIDGWKVQGGGIIKASTLWRIKSSTGESLFGVLPDGCSRLELRRLSSRWCGGMTSTVRWCRGEFNSAGDRGVASGGAIEPAGRYC